MAFYFDASFLLNRDKFASEHFERILFFRQGHDALLVWFLWLFCLAEVPTDGVLLFGLLRLIHHFLLLRVRFRLFLVCYFK